MNSLVALLAFVVAAEYLVIAVDVVPRLARIARVDREVMLAARWGATSFFIGCAVTHTFIALQTLFPAMHDALGMDMSTPGNGLVAVLEMVIPHVAQVFGGAIFIGISRSRLEVNITTKADAAAARELDEQLRSALDAAPVGIAFHAAANQPRYANAAYQEMVGLTAPGAEPDEDDLLDVVHPDDRPIGADALRRGRAGEPVDVELRVVRPDGAVHWLHLRRSQVVSSAHPRVTTVVEDVTDRVTAQSVLAASERRFTRLADSVSVGINLRQLHPPQFLWANAAYSHIVGANLTQDSTEDDPALVFIHPEDEETVMTQYWTLAQMGLVAQSEHRVVRPDGNVRWVHTTSSPVHDDDGRVVQVAGTVEDITARKEVEQAVLDERRRLRQAESVGRTGSWERDLKSGAVTWSAGMFELCGIQQYDPDDQRSRARQQIHPDDRGPLDLAIAACATDGTPFELRYRITRVNDGALRWMNVRGEAGYRDGERTWIRSSVADITDQVAVEAAAVAVAARAFQQAVFNASPDVISVWDFATGSVAWTNRSIGAELGYSPHELAAADGREMSFLVHPDDRARVDEAMACARDSLDDQVFQVDYRMLHKDGSSRWFSRRTAPLNRDEKGRVNLLVEVIRDINAAMATEMELRHSALHDSLTGLPNRTLLFDRIESAVARANREGTELGILFCDLDGFKRINDTGGHAAGDAVLVEVAERLRQSVRRSDSLARVGGDEFVIVLEPGHPVGTAMTELSAPDHGPDDGSETPAEPLTMREVAELVASRIRASLVAPVMHNGQAYSVSVSIGMTFASGDSVADDVLRDADSAMYLAKQRGRDRFEVFDDLSRAAAAERLVVERALRDALGPEGRRHAELGVAFQPVYDLTTGHLVGFEALARLTGEGGTAIPPDVFIPVAENTGLIAALGAHVLDLGLAGLSRWRADHVNDVPVTLAVNLSARQAHQCDLHDLVLGALARHGLRPADLTLELTESILLDTGSAGLGQLSALHDAGVGIAIDDFGTGYASLRYLTTLPISSLKVDKSFTAGLPGDETSSTIVRAIAALAAQLGLTCVVEGIETTCQLAALPPGVLGQGYLLGRPTRDLSEVVPLAPVRPALEVPDPSDSSTRSHAGDGPRRADVTTGTGSALRVGGMGDPVQRLRRTAAARARATGRPPVVRCGCGCHRTRRPGVPVRRTSTALPVRAAPRKATAQRWRFTSSRRARTLAGEAGG